MNGRRGSTGGGGDRASGNYSDSCLTMHQPWASLLVHGIKRIEGRSWPAPLTGRLWIHAASKVPEPDTIKAMENFYREIYAVNGITNIKFPQNYPVSRLLGCVEVVGCLKRVELVSWESVPESVRLEGLTDFCWLCSNPQKLIVPLEMRGYQGVYNLEKRIYEAAVSGLTPIKGPLPVRFPLPNPRDSLSLKPGSLLSRSNLKASEVQKSRSVSTAIAGARAAATQFSRRDESRGAIIKEVDKVQKYDNANNRQTVVADHLNRTAHNLQKGRVLEEKQSISSKNKLMYEGSCLTRSDLLESRIVVQPGSSRLFSEALKGMRLNS